MNTGINGRLLMLLYNYVTDRKYSLMKRNLIGLSLSFTFHIGLSYHLCYVTSTSDAVKSITSKSSEYADDKKSFEEWYHLAAAESVLIDGDKIAGNFCDTWNIERRYCSKARIFPNWLRC